jgi:hypothetical protein
MKEEYGFFVKYGDCFYSESFSTLNAAREDARIKSPKIKLEIYHGKLRRHGSTLVDDKELYLVPRLNGYI